MSKLRILLLSALLLLSQGGMLLHELDVDHYDISHIACEICLTENGLDGALGAGDTAFAHPVRGNADKFTEFSPPVLSDTNTQYQSRAPPLV